MVGRWAGRVFLSLPWCDRHAVLSDGGAKVNLAGQFLLYSAAVASWDEYLLNGLIHLLQKAERELDGQVMGKPQVQS